MHFMFREHVVRLREAHIKWCGFRKPPTTKNKALLLCGAMEKRGGVVFRKDQAHVNSFLERYESGDIYKTETC